jgi:probable O-glycosylation ligase (exosortase A-associated)
VLRSLLILGIIVPGIIAGLRDRFPALLLYVWFALFRPQEWLWIDVTALRLSLVLALILIGPALTTGIWPNLTHPLSIGTIAFLMMGMLAQFGAMDPETGWAWLDFQTRLTFICLLSITLVDTRDRFVKLMAVVGCSLGFHAAKAGLASLLGGGVRFHDGLAGAFPDNNGYALATVMVMPLVLATAQNMDREPAWMAWLRRGLFLWVPLCALTVVSTFSRGGFLAMALAILVFVLLQKRRLSALVGMAVVALLALAFVPLPEGYLDRLNTIQTYDEAGQEDESALGRLHFWRVAIIMAQNRPFGVGLRNYEAAYDTYDFSNGAFARGRSVHNSHFQVLAELGFPGAAIWITLFLVAFALTLRVRSRSKRPELTPDEQHFFFTTSNALTVSMVGFLVGGSFVASALNDVTWLTFALVAAVDRLSSQALAAKQPAPAWAAPASGKVA